MESFTGKLAVVTGGGSGMGRELVRQLAAHGCSVATCDLHEPSVTETATMARADAPPDVVVTSHVCDVADEAQVQRFGAELLGAHDRDHVDLVFANAGIGGGGSFITDSREEWERTFGIDWWGVYNTARVFLPLLIASEHGVLVNTSSVNGFWASLGPGRPHTAYSAAKFAVKGFSEALIEDLRVNAPHVRVAVVMPGHIATDIIANSLRTLGVGDPASMSDEEIEALRPELVRRDPAAGSASPDEIRQFLVGMNSEFKKNAPLSAAEASKVILDGVLAGSWRILVGEDAIALDAAVRARPESAYDYPGLFSLGGGT